MVSLLNFGSLAVPSETLLLLTEIDEFKGAWRAVEHLSPDRLSSLKQTATIESIGSSTRIEGSKLSDDAVELLLADIKSQSFVTRDEQEVAGYAEAMGMVLESWEAISLTENHIKQLHRDLLKHSAKDVRHRGDYKTHPNHVEAFDQDGKSVGVVFRTAPPFETPKRMTELVEWTNAHMDAGEMHPLLTIAIFIVAFLAIHPFQDGNGRLSRILTTLLLLRAGYTYVPYSSLERVVEKSKPAYYRALRQTQATIQTDAPDWQPWISYFLTSLRRQQTNLETRIEHERSLEEALPELSARILAIARERGRVTVGEAARRTGANRNTVKNHVRALSKAGRLTLHGAGRGAWYSPA